MKKILTFISIAAVFAACSTQDKGSLQIKKESVPLDTTGLYKSNVSTDTAKVTQQSVTTQQKTTTTTVQPPPTVIYKTRTIVHNNTRYIPAPQQPTHTTTTTTNTPATPSNGTTGSSGNGTLPSNSGVGKTIPNNGGIVPAHPVPEKKPGWSDAAKDAAIGGVGGAIGGAVLSKNKGKGAIIGGIIGAAGGYIIGRKKDKKAAAADTLYK